MKEYKIKQTDDTMTISNRETGAHIAAYRLTPGYEHTEIAAMRRTIDKHLANNGTLGNYQW